MDRASMEFDGTVRKHRTNCAPQHKAVPNSIPFLYDSNKSDQDGERTTIKHVYVNAKNPFICSFLVLGIYLSLFADNFCDSELLFKNPGQEEKNAPHNYCVQLKEMLKVTL